MGRCSQFAHRQAPLAFQKYHSNSPAGCLRVAFYHQTSAFQERMGVVGPVEQHLTQLPKSKYCHCRSVEVGGLGADSESVWRWIEKACS